MAAKARRTPKPVNIHQAKTQFSKLVARAERGEEVIIARAGKAVAKLSPLDTPPAIVPAPFGFMKGSILSMADDFDAPMPEFEDAFYNGPVYPDESEQAK